MRRHKNRFCMVATDKCALLVCKMLGYSCEYANVFEYANVWERAYVLEYTTNVFEYTCTY